MDKREKKRVAYSVYSRVKKRSKASVTSKWDDTIMLILSSLGRFSVKKLKCNFDAFKFRFARGNLSPISPILDSKLSNFTLIVLEDIYNIYLFFHCDGLYETTGKERSSFFPQIYKYNKCIGFSLSLESF